MGRQWSFEPLKFKHDWPKARARWMATWDRAETDRPLMDIRGPSPDAKNVEPPPLPASTEEWFFDPNFVAAAALQRIKSTFFAGEAVPCAPILMGCYALGCGTGVKFDLARNTVWHPHLMDDINGPHNWHPGPDDPWRKKLTAVIRRLLDLAPGNFFVGGACQVPVNDLLSLIRGGQEFLFDLADNPAVCRRRLEEMLPLWIADYEYFRDLISHGQSGCAWGWPGIWHDQSCMLSQSDMSCMISTAMFEEYVLPELDSLGERYSRIWYHLDGWDARHHLPALLSRPYVKIVQYVSEPGKPCNGPHFMELYRQIQSAGRGLDIDLTSDDLEYVIRRLRPEGLIIRTKMDSPEQAQELLDQAVCWAGTHVTSLSG